MTVTVAPRPSRVRRAAGGPVLVVLALVASLLATVTGAVPAGAAPKQQVFLTGDSTMLGMHASARAIVAESFDKGYVAASCQRLIIESCGRNRPPNTLTVLRQNAHRLGEAVVIMAGYDDPTIDEAVDVIMAETAAMGVPRVLWLTYRTGVSYVGPRAVSNDATFRRHNEVLRAKAAADPRLHLADWDAHSRGHDDWVTADGIHISFTGAFALASFIVGELEKIGLGPCAPARATGDPAPPLGPADAPLPRSGIHVVTPERVLDSRFDKPLAAHHQIALGVAGRAGVPVGAAGVVLNLTATEACGDGYLTVHACGSSLPDVSHVNIRRGVSRASAVVAALDAAGRICLASSVQTDVLVDVTGWLGAGGGGLVEGPARRVLDTRFGTGGVTGPVEGWIPVDTGGGSAAFVNLTGVDPAGTGYLAATPALAGGGCPSGTPVTSSVNMPAGRTVANMALVALTGGRLCVFASTHTHVVVDLLALVDASGRRLEGDGARRLLDTRFTGQPLRPGVPMGVAVGEGDAVLLHLTAVQPGGPGFLVAYPSEDDGTCAAGPPDVSNLNVGAGEVIANLAVVAVGGRPLCLASTVATDVLVDRVARLEP